MATSNDAPKDSGDFVDILTSAFKMYSASWEALKLNLSTFILAVIVPAGIVILGSIIYAMLVVTGTNNAVNDTGSGAFSVIVGVLVLLASIILALIFVPAIVITQLESVKGKKVEFSEVFEKSKKFVLRFIGLGILAELIIALPAALLFMTLILFPLGIIWAVAAGFFLMLAPYILIDKELGIIDSIKASVDKVKANWKWLVAVYIVFFVIGLPSIIPFVGWIASLVLYFMYFCLLPLVYVKKIK